MINIKRVFITGFLAVFSIGCVTTQPTWNQTTNQSESEYKQYMKTGAGSVTGQAFFVQRGGTVVKAAGRTITLDPATSTGKEWWAKAGTHWSLRSTIPNSQNFKKARRKTVADAEGRFKFKGLPPGNYFIRTDVTWMAGSGIQGGLVGKQIVVQNGRVTEIILNEYAQ